MNTFYGDVVSRLRVIFICFIIIPFIVWAQSNADGRIYGSAHPGSVVSIISKNTGFKLTNKIGSDGQFAFNSIPLGTYTVIESTDSGETHDEEVEVRIGEGTGVAFTKKDTVKLGEVVVSASKVQLVDTASSEHGFSISAKEINALPVNRDLTSVALLTPGSVTGATSYGAGNLPTFNGSTPAENVYYLNGMDISDLRTKLSPSVIPFQLYDDFQTKTGGYSAEFGRATGGVVNAVTKRGTNKWEVGGDYFFSPNLDDSSPEVTYNSGGKTIVFRDTRYNSQTQSEANIFAGGPIIKNKLFFYGLANLSNTHSDILSPSNSTFNTSKLASPFYAGKVDWQIFDGHLFEVTYLRNSSEIDSTAYAFNNTATSTGAPQPVGAYTEDTTSKDGGTIQIYRYTGHFFEDLTASALFGSVNRANSSYPSDTSCSFVNVTANAFANNDGSLPQSGPIGCNPVGADNVTGNDKRKQYRLDFAYAPSFLSTKNFGTQTVKFGIDRQDNQSTNNDVRSGGFNYSIRYAAPGTALPNGYTNPADSTNSLFVQRSVYSNSGTDKEELSGLYLEDTWNLNNRLNVTAGIRKDKFKEVNKIGQTFIDLTGGLAPRLGISFDPLGDGNSKFFGNYGRYYTALSTQITVRNGNGELFYSDYYNYGGSISPDRNQIPSIGAQVGNRVTTSPGRVTDPRTLVSPEVRPTYQDEYSLGYENGLAGLFDKGGASVSIRGIYRNLGRTVEDEAVDSGLNKAFAANSGAAELVDANGNPTTDGTGTFANGFDYYFVTNPGQGTSVQLDTTADGRYCNPSNGTGNCTGNLKPFAFSSDGFPKPIRKYYGLELSFARYVPGKYQINGSYTYSHSYGNYEGPSNSTIGQDDIGITQDFDQPGLLDNAYGDLYADRRHNFKLFGVYSITKELFASANYSLISGRATSIYSLHPTDQFAQAYGSFSFFDNEGNGVARGSAGRTPWVRSLDLGFKYIPLNLKKRLTLGFDVFNVFDSHKNYSAVETYGTSAPSFNADGSLAVAGAVDPTYGLPLQFQPPRTIRLSVGYSYGF